VENTTEESEELVKPTNQVAQAVPIKSPRLAGHPIYAVNVEANNMYVKAARKKHGAKATDASAQDEVRDILEREMLLPLSPSDTRVAKTQHRIVKTFLFLQGEDEQSWQSTKAQYYARCCGQQ
jgi:hypothetical protein